MLISDRLSPTVVHTESILLEQKIDVRFKPFFTSLTQQNPENARILYEPLKTVKLCQKIWLVG